MIPSWAGQARRLQGGAGGCDLLEQPSGSGIEIVHCIGLQSIGQDGKHEMPGQVRRGLSPEHGFPAGLQAMEIETAQRRVATSER